MLGPVKARNLDRPVLIAIESAVPGIEHDGRGHGQGRHAVRLVAGARLRSSRTTPGGRKACRVASVPQTLLTDDSAKRTSRCDLFCRRAGSR